MVVRNFAPFLRSSSSVSGAPADPCACQRLRISSFGIADSFMKSLREQILDAVNFGGHIAWRDPGDLRRRRGVQPFQIRQDDLAIERLELLDQLEQAVDRMA